MKARRAFRHAARPLIAVIVMTLASTPAFAQDLAPELLKFLREKLPTTGSIEAVYFSTAPYTHGRIAAGFDVQSGACYKLNNHLASGRDAAGKLFSGTPVKDGLSPNTEAQLTDHMVDGIFTIARLVGILKYPEAIRSVKPRDDGGYIVVMGYRAGLRGLAPDAQVLPAHDREFAERYVIDADARIIETQEVDPPAPAVKYVYSPDSPPGFPVLAEFGSGEGHFALDSFKHHPASDPAVFDMKSVEQTGIDHKIMRPPPAPIIPSHDSPKRHTSTPPSGMWQSPVKRSPGGDGPSLAPEQLLSPSPSSRGNALAHEHQPTVQSRARTDDRLLRRPALRAHRLAKLSERGEFAEAVREQGLVPLALAAPVATLVPIVELIIGTAALFASVVGRRVRFASLALALLMITFTAYAILLVVHPPHAATACGCSLSRAPVESWTPIVFRNSLTGVVFPRAAAARPRSIGPPDATSVVTSPAAPSPPPSLPLPPSRGPPPVPAPRSPGSCAPSVPR